MDTSKTISEKTEKTDKIPTENHATMGLLIIFLFLVLGAFSVAAIVETEQYTECRDQEHKGCPVFTCANSDVNADKEPSVCKNAAFRFDADGNKMCSGKSFVSKNYLAEIIGVSVAILILGAIAWFLVKPGTYIGTAIIFVVIIAINLVIIYWMGITKKGLECFNRKNIKCFNDWSCLDSSGGAATHGALLEGSGKMTTTTSDTSNPKTNVKGIFDQNSANKLFSSGADDTKGGYCDPKNKNTFNQGLCNCSVNTIPKTSDDVKGGLASCLAPNT